MELQEYLDQQTQVNERYKVETDEQANWALRKIKQEQASLKQKEELAQSEIEKIQTWFNAESEKIKQSIEYFEGLLAEYAMNKRKDDETFKSLKLPHGRIGFRKAQPKYTYDDKTLLESLKKANMTDFITVKESPNKTQIKKAFEVAGNKVVNPDTGEILEGVTVQEVGEVFNVKVDD